MTSRNTTRRSPAPRAPRLSIVPTAAAGNAEALPLPSRKTLERRLGNAQVRAVNIMGILELVMRAAERVAQDTESDAKEDAAAMQNALDGAHDLLTMLLSDLADTVLSAEVAS